MIMDFTEKEKLATFV